MDVNQNILIENYSKFNWFDSVGLDKFGRYVVYTHFMNLEVMNSVQQFLDGKQVLIAFAHCKPSNLKNKYVKVHDLTSKSDDEELNYDYLISELDRLQRICGENVLECIFYEIQDGNNAVTNLSSRYPLVRNDLEKLFNSFGFDVLYNEIDKCQ